MPENGAAPTTATTKPLNLIGERTKRQGRTGVFGLISDALGQPTPTWGTYATYRRMRTDPTIALARTIAFAPILAADHGYEADDDAPPEALALVEDVLDPVWNQLVREMLRAVEFGWQAFELVWEVDDKRRLVYRKIKPLLHDTCELLVSEETGELTGLKQNNATLEAGKLFLYSYDVEAGNYYGRSRYENIRENAWAPWLEVMRQQAKYFAKAAGIIPIIRYPDGVSEDSSGAERNNWEIALAILQNLGKGAGVTIPWELQRWAEAAIQKGIDPKGLANWQIDFLEASPGHGSEFLETARYYDSMKFRGFFVPERVGLEGQAGTKAEADTHTDTAVSIAEQDLKDVCRAISRGLVDPLLAVNFGPQYKGKVRAKPGPIVDADRAMVRSLISNILTQPGNLDLMLATVDLDSMLDESGLPKVREVIDQDALKPGAPEEGAAPAVVAPAGAPPAPPAPSRPGRPDTNGPLSRAMRAVYAKHRKGGR